MDDGLDWISIVTILAQRDDGGFTWPKGGYDHLSIQWHSILTRLKIRHPAQDNIIVLPYVILSLDTFPKCTSSSQI